MYKNENLKNTLKQKTQKNFKNLQTGEIDQPPQVEEQYIENLHKQIHFMNLEINVLKEKQQKSKGFFGLQTLMGGKLDPPTDHLIQARSKFNELDKKLRENRIRIEDDILRKKENMVYLLSINKELREYNNKLNEEYKNLSADDLNNLKKKLELLNINKNELLKKEERLDDQMSFTDREHVRLTTLKRVEDFKEELRLKIIEEEKERKKNLIIELDKKIEEAKKTKNEYNDIIENDPQVQMFKSRNEEILKMLQEKQEKLDALTYQIYELKELQKLTVINKVQQSEENTDLYDEVDRLRTILDDEKKINQMKIERKFQFNENELITKKKTNLRIEKNELEESNRKWKDIHNIYLNYKIDYLHLLHKKNELEFKNNNKKEIIENLKKEFNILDPEIKNLKNAIELKIDGENEMLTKKQELNKQVLELKLKYAGLNSRVIFLKENFDLDEVVKNIDLENLRKVITTNNNVNSTINDFIGKWDNMKNFNK